MPRAMLSTAFERFDDFTHNTIQPTTHISTHSQFTQHTFLHNILVCLMKKLKKKNSLLFCGGDYL